MGGRSGLPITGEQITANIIAEAAECSDAEWQAGQNWYADATAECVRIARETGNRADTVAGVVAALSPRISWKRNLYGARALCAGEDRPSGVMLTSWQRGEAVLRGEVSPTSWGAKIGRFYRNLTGDPHAVTVDVWSWRVAMGLDVPEHALQRAGAYEAVEDAYRAAADRLEVYPADLQATTWLHRRHLVNAARMRYARGGGN